MRLSGALCCAFVVAMGLGPAGAQEQAPTRRKVRRNDIAARAYKKAETQDGLILKRVTMAPNDECTVLAICEYGAGEIGLFVGEDDPTEDKFVLVARDNSPILHEAVLRLGR